MSLITNSNVKELLAGAAKMPPARARAVLAAIAGKEERETISPALADAAAAFERDMQPVRDAIAGALQAGDLDALRGLRAMLPTLLADVNASPELADVLAFHLGKAVLEAMAE